MQTSILKKRNCIIIQYRVNGKQFSVFTGVSVKDSEWNKRSKSIIGDSSNIISSNQLIKSYRDAVESYIYDLKRNGASYNHEQLKAHIAQKLTAKLKVKNKIDVFYAFYLFIKNKKSIYNPLTVIMGLFIIEYPMGNRQLMCSTESAIFAGHFTVILRRKNSPTTVLWLRTG